MLPAASLGPSLARSTPKKKPPRAFPQHSRIDVSRSAVVDALQRSDSQGKATPLASFWRLHKLDSYKPSPATRSKIPDFDPNDACGSFNAVCRLMPDTVSKDDRIVFYEYGNQIPRSHPTNTKARPDLVAARTRHIKLDPETRQLPTALKNISWSALECVVEEESSGESAEEMILHAGAYLFYLMGSRPDLVVAQAFHVQADNLILLFGIGGEGISYTSISFRDKEFKSLLYAFLHRLHNQDAEIVEPTILRKYNEESQQWTFDIQLPSEGPQPATVCRDFTLWISSIPLTGRRHIFFEGKTPCTVGNQCIRVIKDHYKRPGSRFSEEEVLETIHEETQVPGVAVGVCFDVNRLSALGGRRCRTRVAMEQLGYTFLRVGTLSGGLFMLYDLLEVTRFIYKKTRVLHRDISSDNVLFAKEGFHEPTSETEKDKLASLRYIANTLNPRQNQWSTNLLLIDFGDGEIEERAHQPLSDGFKGSATPLFTARGVELGTVIPSLMPGATITTLPELPPAPEQYANAHPDRLARFPNNSQPVSVHFPRGSGQARVDAPFKHQLCHDAESILWLFLYWIIQARPKTESASDKSRPIDPLYWDHFYSDALARGRLLSAIAAESKDRRSTIAWTHSRFEEIIPLMASLCEHFGTDPHWVDGSKPEGAVVKQADYMHEVFQRSILRFIIEHSDDAFMTTPLAEQGRPVERRLTSQPDFGSTAAWRTPMLTAPCHPALLQGVNGESESVLHIEI